MDRIGFFSSALGCPGVFAMRPAEPGTSQRRVSIVSNNNFQHRRITAIHQRLLGPSEEGRTRTQRGEKGALIDHIKAWAFEQAS